MTSEQRAEVFEQLLGMRQQIRNLASQMTYLMELVGETSPEETLQEVQGRSMPKRFGAMSDVIEPNNSR